MQSEQRTLTFLFGYVDKSLTSAKFIKKKSSGSNDINGAANGAAGCTFGLVFFGFIIRAIRKIYPI